MSLRLGIDASQTVASCAVASDDGIIVAGTMERPIEHFPALIRDVTARAGIALRDVDEIVVCVGPGSQTGTRASVVVANALALALRKPVSGVLSTDAAAALAKACSGEGGVYQVAVSAGRRRFYVEAYRLEGEKICRLDKLELMEEPPVGVAPSFVMGNDKWTEFRSCACGALLVAGEQRQLMAQALREQVAPYERSEGV